MAINLYFLRVCQLCADLPQLSRCVQVGRLGGKRDWLAVDEVFAGDALYFG